MAGCARCKVKGVQVFKWGHSGVHMVLCADCFHAVTHPVRYQARSIFGDIFDFVKRVLREIHAKVFRRNTTRIQLQQENRRANVAMGSVNRKSRRIIRNQQQLNPFLR